MSLSAFSHVLPLSSGQWKVELQLNDSVALPFQLTVKSVKNNQYEFTIFNASESIKIENYFFKEDSLIIDLPVFKSEFRFKIIDENNMIGVWNNYAKGNNYFIPTKAFKSDENRFVFNSTEDPRSFNGKFNVLFSTKEDPYPAIGIFSQNKSKITGTFLTETGDYRFLEGNVNGEILFLSCFDGSHAFYFEGKIINDTIKGIFFSGIHYYTDWVGVKNKESNLIHPDSITTIINAADIRFSLPDSDSIIFTYPNPSLKNKVTIIQLMGSWCPNCMDETKFYQTLYAKYKNEGLEIISIAFEVHKGFNKKIAAVSKLKNHFNIEYKILFAQNASKETASALFPNLNGISSFPTSIFIDKNNKIRSIHTGFYGPVTGEYYKAYVKNTYKLIETLLSE